ncbi:eCIS core domain-containing protein [Streptomyces apricus]|uniref:DUF4157 domain-containing protein n=1 Tax=Streptomyces apricus TaxID=1828112 RepID=A0A5B0ANL6_9ACTN|nr:DUF4157 domain-containing protein [Streptomyces apricus]KAA0930652.1 DUF4157 domain-containing protein [Streptomyces apricus]
MAPHRAAGAGAGGRNPASMLALQRSVGNASVVQLLANERHSHSSSCGHSLEGPVQRRMHVAEHQHEDEQQAQAQAVHEVLKSSGRPLDGPTLNEMQARHGGADFSTVRVHDDIKAQRSAAAIGARAYTSGENIVRGKDGFDKKTLAHELKHVLQQREGPVAGTPTGGGLTLSDRNDHHEREAEASSNEVMAGPVPVQSAPATEGAESGPQSRTVAGSPNVQRARTKEESRGSRSSGKRKADREKGESPPRERRKTRGSERPAADLDRPILSFTSEYTGDDVQNLDYDANIGFQQTATLYNPENSTSTVAANYHFWQEVTDSNVQVVESMGLNKNQRSRRGWQVDGPYRPNYDDWSIHNGAQAISFTDSPGFTGTMRMSPGYFLKSYQVSFRWKVAKNNGQSFRNTTAGWTSPVMTHTVTSAFDPENPRESAHVVHEAAGGATWQVDLSGS